MRWRKCLTGVSHESINRLWRAVVLQALLDCAGLGRSLNPSWPEWKHANVKREARRWLLDGGDDFSTVCAAATVPEEAIQKFARRLIKGERQAREQLIEWRDSFAKQTRKQTDDMEIEPESDVPL